MSLIVTGDEQIVCKILSTTIKIIASHTLRPELAPSKILENSLYHKSFICQVLQKRPAFPQDVSKNMEVILTDQNARIRTGGSLLRLMLPPVGETFCQLPGGKIPAAIKQIRRNMKSNSFCLKPQPHGLLAHGYYKTNSPNFSNYFIFPSFRYLSLIMIRT